MVTTPESLSLLLLARATRRDTFGALQAVVVDEWHELIGTQARRAGRARARAAAARSRRGCGCGASRRRSATSTKRATCCLPGAPRRDRRGHRSRKTIVVDSLIPPTIRRFPWAGHLGMRSVAEVAAEIEKSDDHARLHQRALAGRVLVSRAARSSARLGRHHRPASRLARHRRAALGRGRPARRDAQGCGVHVEPRSRRRFLAGRSRDPDRQPEKRRAAAPARRAARATARALRAASRACRRTRSSWSKPRPRERPRATARSKRAGRSTRRSTCSSSTSSRIAVGEGFRDDALLDEVRTHARVSRAHARASGRGCSISRAAAACSRRIPSITASSRGDDGVYRVTSPQAREAAPRADRHDRVRRGRSTCSSCAAAGSGSVEESFLAQLQPGDRFTIGGKTVEFVRMRDMTAWVRARRHAARRSCRAGSAAGFRCRASSSRRIQHELELGAESRESPEAAGAAAADRAAAALFARARAPTSSSSSSTTTREGVHLCVFPFAGRHVHSGSPRWSRGGSRSAGRSPSAWLSTTTASSFCRRTRSRSTRSDSRGALDPADAVEPTSSRASTRRSSRAGTSARSRASPGSCSRVTRATAAARSSSRSRAGCSTTSTRATTRAIRCSRRRSAKCSSASSSCRASKPRSHDLAQRRIVFVRPQRLTPLALPLDRRADAQQALDRAARRRASRACSSRCRRTAGGDRRPPGEGCVS